MKIREILKRGININDSKIQKKLTEITNQDSDLKRTYRISWELIELKSAGLKEKE